MKEQQKRKFKQIHPEIEDGIDLRRCPLLPGAHPLQPVLLQLDDLKAEVCPQPALVELHLGKNKHR